MRTRTSTRIRPGLRSAATAVLLGSLILALAACGSGDDDDGSQVASLGATATTADGATSGDGAADDGDGEETDPEEAFVAFAECMREHGVDMADPEVDGSGRGGVIIGGPVSASASGDDEGDTPAREMPDQETFEAAQEACEPLITDVVADRQAELDPEEVQKMQDQALAFSECMRDHGIDFPDPIFGDSGTMSISLGEPGEDGPDPSDPDFQAAQEACADEAGGGFIGATPVGATGGPGEGPVTNINVGGDSEDAT